MRKNVLKLAVLMTVWLVYLAPVEPGQENRQLRCRFSGDSQLKGMQSHKAFVLRRHYASRGRPPVHPLHPKPTERDLHAPLQGRVYTLATTYGADPTGTNDSTAAILAAFADAAAGPPVGFLMHNITNLGGARIDLEGGVYKIRRPIRFPTAGVGNVVVSGGSLKAAEDFPAASYLIDLSSTSPSYAHEFITLKNLLLDCNFVAGGINIINSLRTLVEDCYIVHFTTNGIHVKAGHETYIHNTFLGQHVTAGGDSGERNFTGVGITLDGNDNAVTDVIIFSAAVGILISGQANVISGVHCYNKATGFGGIGIHVKLPGLTQTRIVNSYLDYTGIIAEDPVLLEISGCFFLGNAFISLRSVSGIARGVTIVDNMFSGSARLDIVRLDSGRAFRDVDQVVVDRNVVDGMRIRSTVARGSTSGNGSLWTVDFGSVLLFPDMIKNVQYSLRTPGRSFPLHALRNVSNNRVVIESDRPVQGTVFVAVDQSAFNVDPIR